MVMYVIPVKQVKAGDILVADGGFTCLRYGEECEVKMDRGRGLYVDCAMDKHYLDGQLSDDLTEFVGFLKKGSEGVERVV